MSTAEILAWTFIGWLTTLSVFAAAFHTWDARTARRIARTRARDFDRHTAAALLLIIPEQPKPEPLDMVDVTDLAAAETPADCWPDGAA